MKPPIADPFPAPNSSEGGRVFRVDFFRSVFNYFWCLSVIVALECGLLQALMPLGRVHTRWLPLLLFVVIGGALIAAAFAMGFSIQTDEQGVKHRQNFWDSKREVAWRDMTRVRRRWIGIPYAVVSTAKRRNAIWLPLYLGDMPAFARAVDEMAPEDNALRLWLEKRGFGT